MEQDSATNDQDPNQLASAEQVANTENVEATHSNEVEETKASPDVPDSQEESKVNHVEDPDKWRKAAEGWIETELDQEQQQRVAQNIAAIDTKLNKASIQELKSLAMPPPDVVSVCEAVEYMFEKKKRKKFNFNLAKKRMANPKFFVDSCLDYDVSQLEPKHISTLKDMLKNQTIEGLKNKSSAASSLLEWIFNACSFAVASALYGIERPPRAEPSTKPSTTLEPAKKKIRPKTAKVAKKSLESSKIAEEEKADAETWRSFNDNAIVPEGLEDAQIQELSNEVQRSKDAINLRGIRVIKSLASPPKDLLIVCQAVYSLCKNSSKDATWKEILVFFKDLKGVINQMKQADTTLVDGLFYSVTRTAWSRLAETSEASLLKISKDMASLYTWPLYTVKHKVFKEIYGRDLPAPEPASLEEAKQQKPKKAVFVEEEDKDEAVDWQQLAEGLVPTDLQPEGFQEYANSIGNPASSIKKKDLDELRTIRTPAESYYIVMEAFIYLFELKKRAKFAPNKARQQLTQLEALKKYDASQLSGHNVKVLKDTLSRTSSEITRNSSVALAHMLSAIQCIMKRRIFLELYGTELPKPEPIHNEEAKVRNGKHEEAKEIKEEIKTWEELADGIIPLDLQPEQFQELADQLGHPASSMDAKGFQELKAIKKPHPIAEDVVKAMAYLLTLSLPKNYSYQQAFKELCPLTRLKRLLQEYDISKLEQRNVQKLKGMISHLTEEEVRKCSLICSTMYSAIQNILKKRIFREIYQTDLPQPTVAPEEETKEKGGKKEAKVKKEVKVKKEDTTTWEELAEGLVPLDLQPEQFQEFADQLGDPVSRMDKKQAAEFRSMNTPPPLVSDVFLAMSFLDKLKRRNNLKFQQAIKELYPLNTLQKILREYDLSKLEKSHVKILKEMIGDITVEKAMTNSIFISVLLVAVQNIMKRRIFREVYQTDLPPPTVNEEVKQETDEESKEETKEEVKVDPAEWAKLARDNIPADATREQMETILKASRDALSLLNKADITEILSFSKPSPTISQVLEALLYMFEGKKRKSFSMKVFKNFASKNLLNELMCYNVEGMSFNVTKNLKAMLESMGSEENIMASSKAAGQFYRFMEYVVKLKIVLEISKNQSAE